MSTPTIPKATPMMRQNNALPNVVPRITWTDVVAVSGTATTYTVPTNVSLLRMTPTSAAGACFGNLNGVAAVPAAGITNGSGSFPIIAGQLLNVKPGDSLSLVGSAAGYISLDAFT